jgi:hypothetical protein
MIDPSGYPVGIVQRALDALVADPAFAGVAQWLDVLPGSVFVHPHSPGGPPPGPDLEAWYAACAARGDGVVRMAERVRTEHGWRARVLAGVCSCGMGFRTHPEVTRPATSKSR